LLGVIPKETPERRDCLVDGVWSHDDPRPDLVQQVVDAHDFPGTLSKA